MNFILLLQDADAGRSWLSDNWLVDTILKGGPEIMIPLFIFSIITVGVLIERLYKYFSVPNSAKTNEYLNEIEGVIQQYGDIEKVEEHIKKGKGILKFVFLRIIMRYKFFVEEKRPILDMRNGLLDTADDSAREYLEEFLPVINTIASVATLLGLLGTIMGMISSFDEIAKGGKGDPAVVAGGISIALLTTAAGLIVAIPAVLSYSFLKRKMEKIVSKLEPFSNHFINYILRDLARLSTYKAMLMTAYRDGVLNKEEEEFLKAKRVELNISEEEFVKLAGEVKKNLNVTVDLS
ncbi:MAG: MotA/TolQ/ExbB proton channel family protein [Ignavibacteriaceae bacterium]|nr:MotA/TolQ/ExbB proton channel family protein [Ignavibacteriaceae bacterium]